MQKVDALARQPIEPRTEHLFTARMTRRWESPFRFVHRSEQRANLSTGVKALFAMLRRGELGDVLSSDPRITRPTSGSNRRLLPSEIDQLVADYRGGIRSIYTLADIYGVHRGTVAQRLRERGVRLGRLPMEQSEIERARSLDREGLSLNEIGRRIGRDPKTVKAAL